MQRERVKDGDVFVHALTRVVDERGWAGTSPNLVARAAHASTADFYDRYRSLEHCFLAAYDRTLARLSRTATRAVAGRTARVGRDAWQEQLDAIFGALLAFFSVEPALARICLIEVLDVGPAARARRDDALAGFVDYVESLRLVHGEPMPPLAAEVIVLGTVELIQHRVARGETDSLPQVLPELRPMWSNVVEDHASRGEVPPVRYRAVSVWSPPLSR